MQEIGRQAEKLLSVVPGTRNVFAERIGDGYFLDVNWDRQALARYGLSMEDAQSALSTAVGGENVSTVIKARERYPVNVRYLRDFRSDLESLGRVLVSVTGDKQIPLSELATIRTLTGPSMIRNEDGLLTENVFVDVTDVPVGDYVEQAQRELQNKLKLPPGYSVLWSGQYETALRVRHRLMLIVPVTIAIILFLLYCNTRSAVKNIIVSLGGSFFPPGRFLVFFRPRLHNSDCVLLRHFSPFRVRVRNRGLLP